MEKAIGILREKNKGVCNVTGKSFGELIEHFIIGGDETNLICDADGDMKIIGEFGRKKHEKKVSDCRSSCTMYRTGSAGGSNGPTAFIMAGKYARSGYTAEFLEEHGCAPGSNIQMTERAFMTEDAWLKMTPDIIRGYRSMPFIEWNPQWWVVEIFDGFGAHLNNIDANKMRWDAKLISIKEEGDSSSINQAYDKQVARSDKRQQRMTLGYLRQLRGQNRFVDQWSLIHVGMAAVRYTGMHPELWVNSFIAVNLHPRHMLSFKKWCEKITPFLQAADCFDLITQDKVDEYQLLPLSWQAMPSEHKQLAVSIFEKHEKSWTADCVVELRDSLGWQLSDMGALQVAVWLAVENPSHIERGIEDEWVGGSDDGLPAEVVEVESGRKTATHDLSMFQLKPEGMTGMNLFEHMIGFRLREFSKDQTNHNISDAVGVVSPIKGYPQHQKDLMQVDYHRVIEKDLMDSVGNGGTLQQAARARLDMCGAIKSHSMFVNAPERLQRHLERTELALSVGHIQLLQKKETEKKAASEKEELRPLLQPAVKMVRDGNTGKPFTRKHIRAILLLAFEIEPKKSAKRSDLLEELHALVDGDNLGKLDFAVAANKEAMAADLHPIDLPPPSRPQVQRASAQPPEPAPAAATASRPNVHWLYTRCVEAKGATNSTLSPLEIAIAVLRVLRKIENERGCAEFEDDNACDYARYYFSEFSSSGIGGVSFISDLAQKTAELIEDGDLSEAELRRFAMETGFIGE